MKRTSLLRPGVGKLMSALIQILIPLALVLANVRLLLTPAFVRAEYATPGFPDDPYGFSLEDRLRWSAPSLGFVLKTMDPSFLGDLRFDDGTSVFNSRELSHMVDVQRLVVRSLQVWVWTLAALALVLGVTWRREGASALVGHLRRAGWTVLIVIGGLVLVLALSFSTLFVGFHQVFFDAGTWVFYRSDTLIRLFPERFWRDSFAALLLLTLAEGGLLVAVSWVVGRWRRR